MARLHSRRRDRASKCEDALSVLMDVGFKGKKRGPKIPEQSDFMGGNQMHAFCRSTIGSYRGLRNQTRNQVVFKMKKSEDFRVQETAGVWVFKTAMAAIETMCRYGLGPDELTPEYRSFLEGNRVKFYTTEFSRKAPFRTFTALKAPQEYKMIRKVDLVWSDRLSNYVPPKSDVNVIGALASMTPEEKLNKLIEYERVLGMEMVVHHNCGEPKQGFKYSLTSEKGFAPACSLSPPDVKKTLFSRPQVWGGASLCVVMDDAKYRDELLNASIRLCVISQSGDFTYRSRKHKFESTEGMNFTQISANPKMYRALDDSGLVIYKLSEPDWTDIDPQEFGELEPSEALQSALSCTTLQGFNYNNYSRTSNRVTKKISDALKIDLKEWTVSGTHMSHESQNEVIVSDKHYLTHLDPNLTNTGSLRVSRRLGSQVDILCIGPDGLPRELCRRCARVKGMRDKR